MKDILEVDYINPKIRTPKHVPSSRVCQFLHLQNQKQQAFTAVTLLTMLIVIWTFK